MRKATLIGIVALVMFIFGRTGAFAQGGEIHVVQAGETLNAISGQYGVSVTAIMAANNITNADMVYAGQKLIIPGGDMSGGVEEANFSGSYTVQAGDTLNSIALKYGVSTQALAMANGLNNADVIYEGQVLKVPAMSGSMSGGMSMPHQPLRPAVEYKCGAYYTVKLGDTLTGISIKYNVSLNALTEANMLPNSDAIYEGQKLCIPGIPPVEAPMPPVASETQYHIVKKGDTVSGIAKKYGVSESSIIQANNLSSDGRIYEGQRLIIVSKKPMQPMPEKPVHPGMRPDPNRAPPPPEYMVPERPQTENQGCFNPADNWKGEQVTVQAVNSWCAMMDFVDDPDQLTSIAIRTVDRGGVKVVISQNGETIREATTDNNGWLIMPVSPGSYAVAVDDAQPSEAVSFTVDAGKRAWLEFQLKSVSVNPRPRNSQGWSGRVAQNGGGVVSAQGVSSVIIVRGPARGLPILLQPEGGSTIATCYTGTKPEYGTDACEFGGLWPGTYTLVLDGAGVSVQVYVDGVAAAEVVFDRMETQ